MRAPLTALMLAASVSAGPACAETPDYAGMLLANETLLANPPRNCEAKDAALNTFQLQQCAALAFREADRAMGRAYREALEAGDPGQNDRLKQAQRTWLAFRNVQCDWEAAQYRGGTLAPVVMGTCLVGVTRARTAQITAARGP